MWYISQCFCLLFLKKVRPVVYVQNACFLTIKAIYLFLIRFEKNYLFFFFTQFFHFFSVSAHGYFGYVQTQCRVPGSIEKTEFIFSVTYNKIEYIRYNSTEDKAVGYTEFGEKWAEDYNKNKILLAQAEFGLDKCKGIAKFIVPNVILQSVCCDFYHKPIKLTWLRDDKEVTTDVTSTEELADGDWYYQIHSHLEYFPKPGEKVSCVVEHASSHKPMIYLKTCLKWAECISFYRSFCFIDIITI
uniref:Si:busm1-228j01.4 n=1 Tax=Cyprinus carpio TaxID=7962 RepID=A0A8C1WZP5_CYPCA